MKTRVCCSLIVCCLCSCRAAPPAIVPPDPGNTPHLEFAQFPGARTGFDDRSPDAAWDGNDEVLFALRLRKGAEVHRWLLHLEVVLGEHLIARVDNDPDHRIELWETRTWTWTETHDGTSQDVTTTSRMLPVLVTIRDQHGARLDHSLVKLPANLLGRGLLPAIERARHADPEPLAGDASRPMVEAMIATMALLHVVQQDDVLADYFWQVVEKPGLWSVLTHLGVQATMTMPFEQSLPATRLPAGLPPVDRAFVVPLRIEVNGHPALLADVVAVDAARPYALCGGMVAAVARHPTRPEITFELQLLAARLGQGGKPRLELEHP